MTFLNDLIASFRIFYSNFNAAYGRLINTVLLCLVLFVLAVVAVRTLRLNRRIRRTEVGLEMPQPPRQQAWCQALSQAIQIPTVTGDTAQMEALYQWLQTQFPTVFSSLETTRLPSGALLLRWRGTATGGQKPVLLCAHMDVVPVFLDHIHHVDRHHHRDAELGELGGQIQVAFQVGAVDDVQDRIRPVVDEVIAGHHLFQRVRGQRVDARQVHNRDVAVLFQPAFLFLDRNARPVADKLVGAGQRVEQGGFPAVRIPRQGYSNIHRTSSLPIFPYVISHS